MKLIKINTDHYVVVDDSEIEQDDYITRLSNKEITKANDEWSGDTHEDWKKITHSTQPLDTVNGFPAFIVGGIQELSLQEVKELIGELPEPKLIDSMGMRYRHDFGLLKENEKEGIRTIMKQLWEEVVGLGFYKLDNKEKKYTEQDMRKVFLSGVKWDTYKEDEPEYKMDMDEVFIKTIQSLQPKTSWEVQIIDGKLKLK